MNGSYLVNVGLILRKKICICSQCSICKCKMFYNWVKDFLAIITMYNVQWSQKRMVSSKNNYNELLSVITIGIVREKNESLIFLTKRVNVNTFLLVINEFEGLDCGALFCPACIQQHIFGHRILAILARPPHMLTCIEIHWAAAGHYYY